MIRRLIILLLIVGCEESGITSNGLTDGTAVTDTLYVFNYDTLIFTNYDTTIVNNYDTLIVTNYDTTIFNNYDTTIITNNDTLVIMDTIYIELEDDELLSLDWILIKNPDYIREVVSGEFGEEINTYSGIGYTFIGNSSISNHSLNSINSDGLLFFDYNLESFSFDLSDSYNEELDDYFIVSVNSIYDVVNIYCYSNMSYCHLVESDGLSYVLYLTNPFEIIDYR